MAKRKPSLKEALKSKTSENPAAKEAHIEAAGQLDTKRLNVNVPAPLYAQLKAQADREGRSITWLVTQWIEEYVKEADEYG